MNKYIQNKIIQDSWYCTFMFNLWSTWSSYW